MEAVRCVALVGCTVHEAHPAVAAANAAHDGVQQITALVHVQGGNKAAPNVETLLQALRRSKASLVVPGTSLQAWSRPSAIPGRRETQMWWTLPPWDTCSSVV